jgi:hypothetical protein
MSKQMGAPQSTLPGVYTTFHSAGNVVGSTYTQDNSVISSLPIPASITISAHWRAFPRSTSAIGTKLSDFL